MDASIKAQWLKALRSGEYKQGQYALRYTAESGEMKYCCLGVLTDILIKRGLLPSWEAEYEGSAFFGIPTGGAILTASLNPEACSLTGLTPVAHLVDPHQTLAQLGNPDQSLAGLNDRLGKTFLEIADIIEAEL